MKCGCKCNNTLRIPYGNPFRLCICRSNVAPGNPDDITFADIDDLQVTLTRIVGDITVAHEVMDNGDLMIIGEATLPATAYGIMMTGTYNGHPGGGVPVASSPSCSTMQTAATSHRRPSTWRPTTSTTSSTWKSPATR